MAQEVGKGKDMQDLQTSAATALMGWVILSIALMNTPNFNKGKEVATKILKIIWNPKEGFPDSPIKDGIEILTRERASKDICFNDVWFSYPSNKEKWLLRRINMKIKGECVGFVGESGWGKSTIIQLRLRFYDPDRGSITIDGTPITEFTLKSLRAWYGLVQQEPLLFNCSILENIIYSNSQASSNDVKISTQITNASLFIQNLNTENADGNVTLTDDNKNHLEQLFSELNNGYRINWGSRGGKLSGGQKQRIAKLQNSKGDRAIK